MKTRLILFFAVPEEARFFRAPADAQVIITGMGRRAARRVAINALSESSPEFVITAGFTGGLDPALRIGDLLFNHDAAEQFVPLLQSLGARPTRFHCAERVAVTALEKRGMREATGCSAVEMESEEIRRLCHERNIPCVTLRVVSDCAEENLPLDFNLFATGDGRTNFPRLIAHVAARPWKVPELLRFQRQVTKAARALGPALEAVMAQSGLR